MHLLEENKSDFFFPSPRQVITVAASNEYDERAYFSSYGNCVELFRARPRHHERVAGLGHGHGDVERHQHGLPSRRRWGPIATPLINTFVVVVMKQYRL